MRAGDGSPQEGRAASHHRWLLLRLFLRLSAVKFAFFYRWLHLVVVPRMPMTACPTWMWASRRIVVQHNDVIIVDFDDFAAVPLVALVGFPPPLDTTADVRNVVRVR